jgi:hypothetical protein
VQQETLAIAEMEEDDNAANTLAFSLQGVFSSG